MAMNEMVMKQLVRDESLQQVYQNVTNLVVDKYIKAHMQIPYGFEHVHRVADQAQTSGQYFVGLLHDIVEDDLATWDEVHKTDITRYEYDALKLLCRKKEGQTYREYINELANSGNTLAIIVKIHDLRDHLRVDAVNTYSESHIKRYTDALFVLLAALRKER